MNSNPGRQWWQQSPSPLKVRYVQQYATGQSALDLGAGAGFYGALLQRQGFQVIGVDLAPRGNYPYPCVQARLAHLPLHQPFDTVLAFDVLEHEPLEAAALSELRRLTNRRLLLSVPNADDTLLTPYNLTFKHHTDKTHQREYTASELAAKLAQAGFRLIHLAPEGPVSPAFLAEFVRPAALRRPTRFLLKGLFRVKVLYNPRLLADLFAVAEPI